IRYDCDIVLELNGTRTTHNRVDRSISVYLPEREGHATNIDLMARRILEDPRVCQILRDDAPDDGTEKTYTGTYQVPPRFHIEDDQGNAHALIELTIKLT